ncbi:uncharacterized protein LOC129586264 [Paramacrobiotus metropolitanus]|uniref:uncharacterized protein LOC129586264 n=1 Tax=Paramacrobiotus metropolitanus TaxID=2943436 RepID=UPI002445A9B5|nr:uncharacterized protein LOC129586264 [Paramacrobiotus metropolitanus]
MAEVTFSVTNRKGKVLIHNGYEYIEAWKRADVKTEDCQTWRCRDNTRCKARLFYVNGKVTERDQHSHAPDVVKVNANSARQVLKARAATTLERPRQIIDEVRADIPLIVAVQMTSYDALAQTIVRQRKAAGVPGTRVSTLADIDESYFLKENARGESILVADTGREDEHRIIVFGGSKCFDHLANSAVWLSDGTFSVSPPIFTHLYTVHGNVCGSTVPLIYGLLPNKCELTYRRFFNIIRDQLVGKSGQGTFSPEYMIMDFEQSSIIAFRAVFPVSKLRGCNFHFGQSVYRKLGNLGLGPAYATDPEFSLSCRMLFALAFVPVRDVQRVLAELLKIPEFPFKQGDAFIDYLRTIYIGHTAFSIPANKCIATKPLFPVEFWSCWDRLENDVHRTTNRLEAWHRAFSDAVNKDHPGIYAFHDLLAREISHQQTEVALRMAGAEPKQKKKYVEVTRRLKKVALSYGQMDSADYLRSVATNLEILL